MKINLTGDWDWDGWMDDEEDDGDGSSIFDFFCAAASLFPPLWANFLPHFPSSCLVPSFVSFCFPHPIPHLSVCIGITVTKCY